jgi:hypothetical protein
MTNETQTPHPSTILCADWGKKKPKRAVYVADVSERLVRRIHAKDWSVGTILDEADRWLSKGPVLATFDAPLGVPESYLSAAARIRSWRSPTTFLEFLTHAHSLPSFFEGTAAATDWKVERPFFSVPPGEGGLKSYRQAAHDQGVSLYRAIDGKTKGKTMFAKSGIPGSVGSAACALWQELGPLLATKRTFRVWPFEGDLDVLLQSSPIVFGEIYPRAAYATALLDAPTGTRASLALAKTDADIRLRATKELKAAHWVRLLGVTLVNLDDAQDNEDDFDACMTAAALLRCTLEELPFCPPSLTATRAEGGILGTGSVNLDLPEQKFGSLPRTDRASGGRTGRGSSAVVVRDGIKFFQCPISGCVKTYANTRGGWDGHVGSILIHPQWHPELVSAEERKTQFEIEFPEFFG